MAFFFFFLARNLRGRSTLRKSSQAPLTHTYHTSHMQIVLCAELACGARYLRDQHACMHAYGMSHANGTVADQTSVNVTHAYVQYIQISIPNIHLEKIGHTKKNHAPLKILSLLLMITEGAIFKVKNKGRRFF